MKFTKSVLVASAMALACGVAFAKDDDKQAKGFNAMDKNADGKLTRAEAKGNKELLKKWKELDRDNDGSLSRTEYLREMARQDGAKVQERFSRATGSGKSSDSAATGSTAPQSQRK